MLKEIYEQPSVIKDTYRGRLLADLGIIKIGGLEEYIPKFVNADRIIIVACGTSWHAGLVAEYTFEDWARIPVEVEYASEFRYRNPRDYRKRCCDCHISKWRNRRYPSCHKTGQRKGRFCIWYL